MEGLTLALFLGLMCFTIVRTHSNDCDSPLRISQGYIIGTKLTSSNGSPFCAFRKIPFAKPPVGQLRFEPPQRAGPWHGVYNASIDPPMCRDYYSANSSEDCLYLNLYTRRVSRRHDDNPLPVLVFIPGNRFYSGYPPMEYHQPFRFMDESMVLVVLQYRTGIFGFLSTKDSTAPGNYGMLDQTEALKWVQDNIADFGGDPNRVTISGQGAGGASVIYHMISQASTGLFHGGIAQSGAPLNYWTFMKNPRPIAMQVGEQLQCNAGNNSYTLINCLKQKSPESIFSAMLTLQYLDYYIRPFAPCLENPAYGKFLTRNPLEALERGQINKVPLIIGVTRDEGARSYGHGIPARATFATINDNFYNVELPSMLQRFTRYQHGSVELSYDVKREYMDRIDVNNRTEVDITAIEIINDVVWKAGTYWTARVLAKHVPVFLYVFEFEGSLAYTNFSGHLDVSNLDDFRYLFRFEDTSPRGIKFSTALRGYWMNFVKTHNPNSYSDHEQKWPTAGTDNHLRIWDIKSYINQWRYQSDRSLRREIFWKTEVPFTVNPNA